MATQLPKANMNNAIIFINRNHDHEEGQGIHRQPDNTGSSQPHQSPFYQAIDRHNVWVSGILERLTCDIDRKREERLRASEKLPPLVNYGSHDISSSSSSTVSDCAICLEVFVVGDSCQVSQRDHDLEEGERTIHQPEDNPHSSRQAGVRNNLRIWASLDRIVEEIEARKRQNQQALEKLPSPVNYGSKEVASAYIVCVICLEEFENGQSCQVFSQCNHIFHSNCIGRWLKRRLTCPICRVSVSDV
ncbi:ring-h2 finger protein atl79 [Quercus suber]|uniref:Ring-h2 finger protein atl79 n=1 Tax=Quercus suber TaxID=58331 RepID=A0AAW0KHU2_QUESU